MPVPALGHNQGPPLEEPAGPPWEDGDPFLYFCWVEAWRRAWKAVPYEIALLRQERAEALGLTYEEYTLELLERGRHLQSTDRGRIAAVKRARAAR